MKIKYYYFFLDIIINYKFIKDYNNIGVKMDSKTEELYKKCELNAESGDIMGACQVMLQLMDAKKIEASEEEDQTYLQMAENLKPEDVRKVLELALKIRESGEIKDPELKNAASKLIRAIEMS